MEKEQMTYTTFAFISYSHRDMAVAKWLQRRLEAFKLPTEVHNDIDAQSRYLRPVFRDQSDLNTGILSNELRKHLEQSKYLILICSKNSAKSQWVSDEAKAFVEMGRLDHIIPVIIPDGETPERDLFPIYLREYFTHHPDKELLGVNIGEIGRQKALIRVVSKMLNVSFDSLWKRHLRQKRIRILSTSLSIILVLTIGYLFAIPIELDINLSLQKANLPIGEKVTLNIDGAEYFSKPEDCKFEKISIPGYKRFSKLHIKADSQFFNPLDSIADTGFGTNRTINLELKRDDSFAIYSGQVFNDAMDPIEGVMIKVLSQEVLTDAQGFFTITVPLSEQRTDLPISLSKSGFKTIIREDETPSNELKFILHKNN